MEFDEWKNEYVRLVKERLPDFGDIQAIQLAETEDMAWLNEMTPEEALDAQMECWTDDCSGD